MRVLITGSAGFIGGSVGRYAATAGHTVIGIARRSQPDTDWPGQHVAADAAVVDLASIVASAEPDVVFHAAGSASVGGSMTAPLDDFRAAVVSWANLLDGVRRSGRQPLIVFPSSAAVYGHPAELPVAESSTIAPISPYGFHKAACELLAREYAECFELRVLVLRVFSVFGATQRRLLIWDLYRQAVADAPEIWLDGSGDESRDYLHIDDFSALALQLSSAVSSGLPGLTIVNTGSGDETSVLTMADYVRQAAGVPDKPIRCHGHARTGDPRRWRADIGRLCSFESDFRPKSLEGSVHRCVTEWNRLSGRRIVNNI